jgi:hypothetical protein
MKIYIDKYGRISYHRTGHLETAHGAVLIIDVGESEVKVVKDHRSVPDDCVGKAYLVKGIKLD